ncbi:S-layer homology domain-containing protein [Neomoorella thermoacetica]|uniref:S-layer homology domain-containing protein n=1 Tax=Neomoorella thermoacetica TaxID=1525 RepID=UPI0008FB0F23|nr:S-layer homology domain-containing protein [Moorella thermoacetica]OIQ54188.1 endo-1,4-beta-xylanase A precursor [Moorella thermoacetica]
MKRCFLIILAFLIVASPGPALAAWGDGLFPDALNHWAAEPLNYLGALDIVRGYPDGTCRPDQPLTAVEAVVLLMRATEYTAARPTNMKIEIPAGAVWAKNDLALAVQNGIVANEELRPSVLLQPAPRYLVWQFLARSLKIPLDRETALDFNDAAQVPAGAVPAASTLVRLGILRGQPDGTLRPLDTITRAELLALLFRMVEDGWLNPLPARRLEGWVQAVRQDAGRSRPLTGSTGISGSRTGSPLPGRYIITLSTPGGGSKDYPLATNAGVFNLTLPTPFALENLHVVAALNRRNEVAFIKAYEPRQPGQLTANTGTVEKVIQGRNLQLVLRDLDHELHTYDAHWATTVPGGLLSLKQGQWVKVALNGTAVWNVEPLDVKKVTGTIETIEDRKLYLDKFDKNLGNVFLDWERARLSGKDGTKYTGSGGLKLGSKVEITCLDWDKVLEIKIQN